MNMNTLIFFYVLFCSATFDDIEQVVKKKFNEMDYNYTGSSNSYFFILISRKEDSGAYGCTFSIRCPSSWIDTSKERVFKSYTDLIESLEKIVEIWQPVIGSKINVFRVAIIFTSDSDILDFVSEIKNHDLLIRILFKKAQQKNKFQRIVFHHDKHFRLFDSKKNSKKDFKDEYFKRKETVYPVYQIERDSLYTMMISSNDIPDQFFINSYMNWDKNCIQMIDDKNTKEFMLNELTAPMLRFFNIFTLEIMCNKSNLEIYTHYEAFCSNNLFELQNFVSFILDKNTNAIFENYLTLTVIDECLCKCKKLEPIIRFIQLLMLIIPKIFRKALRSTLYNMDGGLCNFLLTYLETANLISSGEKAFIIETKNRLVINIFQENLFYNQIIDRFCNSNKISLSDNIEENNKFIMILFIGFVRSYENINIPLLVEYLNHICFNEIREFYNFKNAFDTKIRNDGTIYFLDLLESCNTN